MIKRPQKKATTKPKLNSRGGFKVVPAPNDANRRQLLSSRRAADAERCSIKPRGAIA